ncbi:hypothetical protein [Parafrankia sp. EUN1f]|uniref:hypothetical protein n=1 Tax=Parafrankia sp. EUN1f TaxID=102897 RepID=UPI0001C4520D|nr:hypothetical protein [Parafrankia sp. EUN1f]EFC82856.1 hypothetical protein FrEUN1fDRAFT_4053 [Parafrankia sp. EUN1f]
MEPLTLDEIRALPPVIDLPTAARAFKIGRTLAYSLARTGDFPCPVQRYGRLYRVLTVDVREALGLTDDIPATDAEAGGSGDEFHRPARARTKTSK